MIDLYIILAYIFLILIIGIGTGIRVKDVRDFAIGPRNHSDFVLLATVFATLVGAGSTIGIAEKTYKMGIVSLVATLGLPISRVIVATVIAPKMHRFFGCLSAAEIMGRLYGAKAQVLTGIGTIFTNLFVISAQISAIQYLCQDSIQVPFVWGIALGIGTIVVYSTFGGIKAVTATDALQFGILIIAIPTIALVGLFKVGGFHNLLEIVPSTHLSLTPGENLTSKNLLVLFLFALPTISPVMTQRLLMGKDTQQVKRVLLVTAGLYVPFYAFIGLIGLVAYALNPSIDPNLALPTLINTVLPVGVRGFVLAGMLAIVMSTMDSFFNSTAVAISYDILPQIQKKSRLKKYELPLIRTLSCLIGALAITASFGIKSVMGSIFASMSIWTPFFFPPLFLGICGAKIKSKEFWGGFSVSGIVWLVLFFGTSVPRFVPTLVATFVNVFVLLLPQRAVFKNKILRLLHFSQIMRFIRSEYTRFSEAFRSYFADSEQFRPLPFAFFLLGNLLITLFFSLQGEIHFYFSLSLIMAVLCFLVLTKDYWVGNFAKVYPYYYCFVVCVIFPFKGAFLFFQDPSLGSFWAANFGISLFILPLLLGKNTSILVATLGGVLGCLGAGLAPISENHSNGPEVSIANFCFYLIYISILLYSNHRKDVQEISDIKALSGTMSHALNVPLGAFGTQAESLKIYMPRLIEGYKSSQQKSVETDLISEKALQILEDLPSKMSAHISRLQDNMAATRWKLHLSKANIKPTKCSLRKCVKTSLREHDLFQAYGIKVKFSDRLEDVEFTGIQAQIVLVIGELIKNAVSAIIDAGKGEILIEISQKNRALVIKDTALGIPMSHIEKIFVRHFTTKSLKGGTGLGLFHCKVIMEDLGGSIRCESEESQFTRFILTFPRMETK